MLLHKLHNDEDAPWKEQQLSKSKLARMLKPFGVKSQTVRIGEDTSKGYKYNQLQNAFARYLKDPQASEEDRKGASGDENPK